MTKNGMSAGELAGLELHLKKRYNLIKNMMKLTEMFAVSDNEISGDVQRKVLRIEMTKEMMVQSDILRALKKEKPKYLIGLTLEDLVQKGIDQEAKVNSLLTDVLANLHLGVTK